MVQGGKGACTKPDDLNSIPKTHKVKEKTDPHKLSSWPHTYPQ